MFGAKEYLNCCLFATRIVELRFLTIFKKRNEVHVTQPRNTSQVVSVSRRSCSARASDAMRSTRAVVPLLDYFTSRTHPRSDRKAAWSASALGERCGVGNTESGSAGITIALPFSSIRLICFSELQSGRQWFFVSIAGGELTSSPEFCVAKRTCMRSAHSARGYELNAFDSERNR